MSEPFIGEIRMFAGNFAPRGWALCDGQLLSISEYSALFSLLGTIYGGDGRTTFGLPELRGRVPMHSGSGPGLTPRSQGQRSGSEQLTLTIQNMPAHTHRLSGVDAEGDQKTPAGGLPARTEDNVYASGGTGALMSEGVVQTSGGGQPVNIVQPFLCVQYIIALQGTYPSRN